MVYEVKQEAIEAYKRMSLRNQSFGTEQDGFLPGTDPNTPTRKSIVTTPKKMTKIKGDRSLRVDEWVGGYTPEGQKPKRRSWKVKVGSVPKYSNEDCFLFKNME
mmetsp:Transcript_10167/g.24303  ORF Transcript_10167/g.24303 Transcript_10167/m.24303 type:complete len:104 (-) Transcript_10167:263-574(-)|eukprot:CAMPEP_0113620290 /NCGR_PEP_ID=MMETSP0017_2-20120614/10332_1 /TAXON_ID=2856 /ORGANISM="Cylindrotheca closterium" /LENGTH=103 /DNA_ID=CAMNT_0000529937 /DNA_START=50 /DNA_END=361 /DNA_ORIENTATION=+ /assembly_acc=CAM_ASM_000147